MPEMSTAIGSSTPNITDITEIHFSSGAGSKTDEIAAIVGATNQSPSTPSASPSVAIGVAQMSTQHVQAINELVEIHPAGFGECFADHVFCGIKVTAPEGSTVDITLSTPSGNTNAPGVYQLAEASSANKLYPIQGASLTIQGDGTAIFTPPTLSVLMTSGNQLNLVVLQRQDLNNLTNCVPTITASVKPGVPPPAPQQLAPQPQPLPLDPLDLMNPSAYPAPAYPGNVYVHPDSHVGSVSGNGTTHVGPGANIESIHNSGGTIIINGVQQK